MKKIVVLLSLLLLTSCTKRDDYYKLSIDDYSISVGYDDAKYLDTAFDFELDGVLEKNEIVKDVDIYLLNEFVGNIDFYNNENKNISAYDSTIGKLTLYVKDIPERTIKINDVNLDKSIKTNCETFSGKYINKNGYACVISKPIKDKLNVIELHGDYLNEDQDLLDHITIYIK